MRSKELFMLHSLHRGLWLIALMPSLALAASTAQQEFSAAVRSVPDVKHGEALFTANCVICHGRSGGGETDGSVPRIAGQHFRVLVRQLVDFRHARRWDIRMESYADTHRLKTGQDIADVAAYASLLDPRTPTGAGPGTAVARGAALYRSQCQSCHGADGEGDPKNQVPRLAGQHYEYVLRQMYDAVDGRRPNFPDSHVMRLARFDRAELLGLADFISRMQEPTASPPDSISPADR
jgi:cytochrome c553